MRLTPLAYSLLLASSGLLAANSAVADNSSVDLPTMVVSATGYKQQALMAPASITVINSDDISRKPVSDLAEIFRDIPGIDIVDSGVPGMKRLSLRGESSRRVLIKVNGQPIPDHSTYGSPLLIDANMIDRVEVVRGAASVVHGSNAIGGVVNITTRRVQPGEAETNLGAGFYSATRGHRLHAGTLGATEKLDWRVQVAQTDFGDRRVPNKIDSKAVGEPQVSKKRLLNSSSEQKSVSAELGVHLDGQQRIAWQGDYFRQEADAWMPAAPFMEMYLGFPKRDSLRNSLSYSFEDDSALVHAINARAYYQKGKRVMDNTVNVDMPAMGPAPAVKSDSFSRSNDDLTTQGVQLDFASRLWGNNTTLFGFEYQEDNLDVDKISIKAAYPPAPVPSPIVNDTLSTQEAEQSFWSVFVQQQIHLAETLEANLGARYYDIDSKLKKSTERNTIKQSDSQLVGAASLVWQNTDISSLRLNIAQGYTYPSLTQQFSATPGNGAMNYGNAELKAEKATTIELGTRIDGKQLTLDATLYHSRAKDFIDKRVITDKGEGFITACGSRDICFEWFNANRAETTGLELMTAYQIEDWRPYVNAAVQKRKLKYATGLNTWDSGLPIYQGRAGLEWQATQTLDFDFYIRSYGKAKRDDYDSKGQPETQRSTTYAELSLAAYYQATDNLSVAVAALNLTNRSYKNLDELPAAERALDVEVNWRF